MSVSFSRFKPAVKTRTLLLLSASLWTCIGLMLIAKGVYRMMGVEQYRVFILPAAVVAGCIKARFMIDRAAVKGVARIQKFEDGTCLGAVYSWKTWLLVLCMMGLGVILRNSGLPLGLLSFVYLTIGTALLVASRHAWTAWWVSR